MPIHIYDNDRSFQENSTNDLVAYTTEKASSNTMKISLSSIKPGTYALMLHHDENNNNAFDMNGELPIEGWGYSNSAGTVEMPKFSAASFKFDANSNTQEIKIIYAN